MNALRKIPFFKATNLVPLALLFFMAAGCVSVGPDYVRPVVPVNADWHTPRAGGVKPNAAVDQSISAWWTTLNDPVLSTLIDRAVAGNLDLKNARARVRESRARLGSSKADFFPTLSAEGSSMRSTSAGGMATTEGISGLGQTTNDYSAKFDASWELDIFGGTRRSVEASDADLGASQEDLRDTLVSLVSEVALNYINARSYQARLAAAEDNLVAQTETYKLVDWRKQAGLSDELAVEQAKYNLENTRSQIPSLRTGLEEAMNGIAVLLGEQPGKVHALMEKRAPIPTTPLEIAVGVPADTIRRRPDVRRAERQLAAQTARIGVATADLYPKFSLSGSIGLEAPSLGNLFLSKSKTNSAGSSISWSLFRGGAIRQNIEVQSAVQEQYLIKYEFAVLTALKDVENALISYAEEQKRSQALREASQAAQKAVELAQNKYQAGLTDFTTVLDAQRSLYSYQDQAAQSYGTVTSNLIRLYKTLGGGWESLASDAHK
jgi:outer membrane protein, multidrug efflux system